jgi:hypothetical protein
MIRRVVFWSPSLLLLAAIVVNAQEPRSQQEALALLAKIDGKVTTDDTRPGKPVIAIDV